MTRFKFQSSTTYGSILTPSHRKYPTHLYKSPTISIPLQSISPRIILYTMASRLSRTDHQSFEAFRHPAFVQAVNRAANLKCIEAIKSGKLRVVKPQPTSSNISQYTPRMDLIDDPAESNLTAVFEIPGIKTSDISLHILEGHLVVLGERRSSYNATQRSEALPQDTVENDTPVPKLTVPIQELRFGTFRRAIRVPDGLKESDVKASLNEGMLTVTWPRPPAAAIRTKRPHSSSPPTSMATAGTALQ